MANERFRVMKRSVAGGNQQTVTAPWLYLATLAVCCCSILNSQVKLASPDLVARSGSTLSIPITIGNLTELNVTGFEFIIQCDTTVVRLTGIDQQGTLSQGLMMYANNRVSPFNAGRMKVVCAAAKPLLGGGVLVKILATAKKKKNGMTALTLSKAILNSGAPEVQVTNGSLKLSAAGADTGRMKTPVSRVRKK